MWERILVILRKEFIQALREPRLRMLLFVPPMVQLLVFGFAVNLDVDRARIGWMDMDRTPASRELRDRLAGARRLAMVAAPASEAPVPGASDRGDGHASAGVLAGDGREPQRG